MRMLKIQYDLLNAEILVRYHFERLVLISSVTHFNARICKSDVSEIIATRHR